MDPAIEHLASATRRIVRPNARAVVLDELTAAPLADLVPTFSVWRQEQSQWCWAAVTSATANYFANRQRFTQCSFARLFLARDCCALAGPCNKPQSLKDALIRSDNLDQFVHGVLETPALHAELTAGRPVCARIVWTNSGGRAHFVVISGTAGGAPNEFLVVDDPYWGRSQVAAAKFEIAYRSSGRWTHSYSTRAAVEN